MAVSALASVERYVAALGVGEQPLSRRHNHKTVVRETQDFVIPVGLGPICTTEYRE